MEREELLAGQGQGMGSSEEEFGDSEEEFDESSEDDDDIVDIPRPSLRSRRSTASFFVDEEAEGSSQPRGEGSGTMPRSSSQYGTITSLGKSLEDVKRSDLPADLFAPRSWNLRSSVVSRRSLRNTSFVVCHSLRERLGETGGDD